MPCCFTLGREYSTNRFDIKWLKEETLRKCENIDSALGLSEKEKRYLKGLFKRSEAEKLPEKPSKGDFDVLANAYSCE